MVQYGDLEIDLEKPFERISMADAVKKVCGRRFLQVRDTEEARAGG